MMEFNTYLLKNQVSAPFLITCNMQHVLYLLFFYNTTPQQAGKVGTVIST